MLIYLDNEFRCHLTDDGTMRAIETRHFKGKCDTYIEGYRLIPDGEVWVDENGVEIRGEALFPWVDSPELEEVQSLYNEHELLRLSNNNAEYESALTEIENALGVNS